MFWLAPYVPAWFLDYMSLFPKEVRSGNPLISTVSKVQISLRFVRHKT
jgi:hypothetical protein